MTDLHISLQHRAAYHRSPPPPVQIESTIKQRNTSHIRKSIFPCLHLTELGWINGHIRFSLSPVGRERERIRRKLHRTQPSRIKLRSDGVPWHFGELLFFFFFFDLAVQVLGWWVTTTTPVTRENVNPVKWDLGEVPQVNIAPLERQSLSLPPHLLTSPPPQKSSEAPIQLQTIKYWIYLADETWSQVRGGWEWADFLPGGLRAFWERACL